MTKRKRTNNDQQNTTSIQKTTDQPTQTRIIWFYKIVHHLVAIPSGTILIPADSRTRKTQQTFRHIFTSKDTYRYSFFPYKSHNGTIFQNPAYKLKQLTRSENSSHLLFSAHSFKNPH